MQIIFKIQNNIPPSPPFPQIHATNERLGCHQCLFVSQMQVHVHVTPRENYGFYFNNKEKGRYAEFDVTFIVLPFEILRDICGRQTELLRTSLQLIKQPMMTTKCPHFICNSTAEYAGKQFVARVIAFVEFDK